MYESLRVMSGECRCCTVSCVQRGARCCTFCGLYTAQKEAGAAISCRHRHGSEDEDCEHTRRDDCDHTRMKTVIAAIRMAATRVSAADTVYGADGRARRYHLHATVDTVAATLGTSVVFSWLLLGL